MTEAERERVMVEQMAIAMWQDESRRARGRNRLIEWEDENPGQQAAWLGAAKTALEASEDTEFDAEPDGLDRRVMDLWRARGFRIGRPEPGSEVRQDIAHAQE